MKNHREVMGMIANILVVVAILAFIFFGLVKIDIIELPDSIEKLFGISDNTNALNSSDESGIYNSLSYDSSHGKQTETVSLTYENARQLLENVEPNRDYTQEISVKHYDGQQERQERFVVSRTDSLYKVSAFDSSDFLTKQIIESSDGVNISFFGPEGQQTVMDVSKGNFSISDECGFILTHHNFLNGDYPLSEATFLLSDSDVGAQITISFVTELDGYSLVETYTVSLDYGIVVSAVSHENGKLVYSMETLALS